ncbi:MAG TPA: HAD-IIB family hydrolase [Nitrospira sp.]|nr:HAD-IIB family hydrolase [Nitrospira sp.]
MRFVAVAIDFDGTLAMNGRVAPATLAAVERLLSSGRKFIIVTGRLLQELLDLFPQAALCSRIVAENGAVLYHPATRERRLLGGVVPGPLVEALRRKGIPFQQGEAILATVRPHEVAALEAIRDLGLAHHVVFNRGSVMVLPPGVTKASGLQAALDDLQLSAHNVVGIGDSENDHALLQVAELAVAVSGAVPTLREAADVVTPEDNGLGAGWFLSALVDDDAAQQAAAVTRRDVLLGSRADGTELRIPPVGSNLLIAGTSGSGKSTLAHGLLERLSDGGYQICIIDPEGDYASVDQVIVFGNAQRGPSIAEVLTALDSPTAQVAVNLVGLPLKDRPAFFSELLPRIQERQAQIGRPHRILIDEAHHLMPKKWEPTSELAGHLTGMIFVTVHPEEVSSRVLRSIDVAVAMGEDPARTLRAYAEQAELAPPTGPWTLDQGEAVIWPVKTGPPGKFSIAPSRGERRRHLRKYAEGELPQDRSFYFRGPRGKLNLRAQNLMLFCQLADGIDDATWLYHLRRGDYSRWIGEAIKDSALAEIVREVESFPSLSAKESRLRIAQAIEARYTLPAAGVQP